jgi:hypothetical protein
MSRETIEAKFSLHDLAVTIHPYLYGGYFVLAKRREDTIISEDVRHLDTKPVKKALKLIREAVEKAEGRAKKYAGEWLDKAEACAAGGYYDGLALSLLLAELCMRAYWVLSEVDAIMEARK